MAFEDEEEIKKSEFKQGRNCRFYERVYPELEEHVRIKVLSHDTEEGKNRKLNKIGFRCALLEYNDMPGVISLKELKRGRVRSYKKILRVGKEYTVFVLKVNEEEDPSAATVELSLKAVRVESVEYRTAREGWEKARTVSGIMRNLSGKHQIETEELYKQFAWPLAKDHRTSYRGFQYLMEKDDPDVEGMSPEVEKRMLASGVPEALVPDLYKELEKRMKPTKKNILAEIEMKCFSDQGVFGIQHALQAGLDCKTEEFEIVLRVVAAPNFHVCVTHLKPELAIKHVDYTLDVMRKALESKGGRLKIVSKPQITEYDKDEDLALQQLQEDSE